MGDFSGGEIKELIRRIGSKMITKVRSLQINISPPLDNNTMDVGDGLTRTKMLLRAFSI